MAVEKGVAEKYLEENDHLEITVRRICTSSTITWLSHGYYMAITWLSHGYCIAIHYMAITYVALVNSYQAIKK